MRTLTKFAKNNSWIALFFRRKRFSLFEKLINSYQKNEIIRVLDVGGEPDFWKEMKFMDSKNIEITILNLKDVVLNTKNPYKNIKFVIGDACDMKEFRDKAFDFVFSNSVIEHVGEYAAQERMAREVQRIGRSFFVQTPNYWFPFEPHFLTVGFQFLPLKLKAFLLRRFNLGWFKRTDDYDESIRIVNSIRLLKKNEIKDLFPDAVIVPERFLFFTKSFMVYKIKNG